MRWLSLSFFNLFVLSLYYWYFPYHFVGVNSYIRDASSSELGVRLLRWENWDQSQLHHHLVSLPILSRLIFASQSCLSQDSSLACPLGSAQSLVNLQEVLPDQKGPSNPSLWGCEGWFLLVQAQKHRIFPPKKGHSFFLLFLCPIPPCLCVLEQV